MPVRFMPGLMSRKIPTLAAAPLPDLLFIFGQDGNADVGKLLRDFLYAVGVCAYRGIGEKHVGRATFGTQVRSSRVVAHLKLRMPRVDEHAQGVAELGGLDVYAPAIGIAGEQLHCAINICGNDFWIEQQCGREDVRDAGEA